MDEVSLLLPPEIFSGAMLKIVRITGDCISTPARFVSDPVIKSYSLVVLDLLFVHINELVIQKLFSICRLLERLSFCFCSGFNKIQVKSHHNLRELLIYSEERVIFEIDDTPNLRWFCCYVDEKVKHCLFNNEAFQSLTKLSLLFYENMDQSLFLDMLRSKVPFLKSLYIQISAAAACWNVIKFTHDSLSNLRLWIKSKKCTNVIIHAPKLLNLSYRGKTVPNFSLSSNTSQLVAEICLESPNPLDKFLLTCLGEALAKISSKVDVTIVMNDTIPNLPSQVELDELRASVIPCKNVDKLSFEIWPRGLQDNVALVDAFLSVCRPKNLVAQRNNFCRLMLRELMDRKKAGCCVCHDQIKCWRHYLKDVEAFVGNKCNFQEITDSWESFLEGSTGLGEIPCLTFTQNWADHAHVGDFD